MIELKRAFLIRILVIAVLDASNSFATESNSRAFKDSYIAPEWKEQVTIDADNMHDYRWCGNLGAKLVLVDKVIVNASGKMVEPSRIRVVNAVDGTSEHFELALNEYFRGCTPKGNYLVEKKGTSSEVYDLYGIDSYTKKKVLVMLGNDRVNIEPIVTVWEGATIIFSKTKSEIPIRISETETVNVTPISKLIRNYDDYRCFGFVSVKSGFICEDKSGHLNFVKVGELLPSLMQPWTTMFENFGKQEVSTDGVLWISLGYNSNSAGENILKLSIQDMRNSPAKHAWSPSILFTEYSAVSDHIIFNCYHLRLNRNCYGGLSLFETKSNVVKTITKGHDIVPMIHASGKYLAFVRVSVYPEFAGWENEFSNEIYMRRLVNSKVHVLIKVK